MIYQFFWMLVLKFVSFRPKLFKRWYYLAHKWILVFKTKQKKVIIFHCTKFRYRYFEDNFMFIDDKHCVASCPTINQARRNCLFLIDFIMEWKITLSLLIYPCCYFKIESWFLFGKATELYFWMKMVVLSF